MLGVGVGVLVGVGGEGVIFTETGVGVFECLAAVGVGVFEGLAAVGAGEFEGLAAVGAGDFLSMTGGVGVLVCGTGVFTLGVGVGFTAGELPVVGCVGLLLPCAGVGPVSALLP